jgi:hypothetical protein
VAEEAHAAAPSASTEGVLVQALLYRAGRSLAGQEPEYAGLVGKYRRTLGPSYLLAVALGREGKLRQAVLANKDVRRALDLLRQEAERFPDQPDAWSWAMLRAAHPGEADRLAKALREQESNRRQLTISARLNPLSGPTAMKQFWTLQATGREADGRAVLKRCAEQGVPLPEVP